MSSLTSSTYSFPRTTVPGPPVGVNVTLTTAVRPGAIVTGENVADGSSEADQKSPVVEVTVASNALVWATIASVAVPLGAAAPNGPHSVGSAAHGPAVTVAPGGA